MDHAIYPQATAKMSDQRELSGRGGSSGRWWRTTVVVGPEWVPPRGGYSRSAASAHPSQRHPHTWHPPEPRDAGGPCQSRCTARVARSRATTQARGDEWLEW